jgi:hypothetical protein
VEWIGKIRRAQREYTGHREPAIFARQNIKACSVAKSVVFGAGVMLRPAMSNQALVI